MSQPQQPQQPVTMMIDESECSAVVKELIAVGAVQPVVNDTVALLQRRSSSSSKKMIPQEEEQQQQQKEGSGEDNDIMKAKEKATANLNNKGGGGGAASTTTTTVGAVAVSGNVNQTGGEDDSETSLEQNKDEFTATNTTKIDEDDDPILKKTKNYPPKKKSAASSSSSSKSSNSTKTKNDAQTDSEEGRDDGGDDDQAVTAERVPGRGQPQQHDNISDNLPLMDTAARPPPPPTTTLQRDRTIQPTPQSIPGAHATNAFAADTTNFDRAISAPAAIVQQPQQLEQQADPSSADTAPVNRDSSNNSSSNEIASLPSSFFSRRSFSGADAASIQQLLFGSSQLPFLEATLVEEDDDDDTPSPSSRSNTNPRRSRVGGNSTNNNNASVVRRTSISQSLRRSTQGILVHATPIFATDDSNNNCCNSCCCCGLFSSLVRHDEEEDLEEKEKRLLQRRTLLVCCGLGLLLLVGLALGLGFGLSVSTRGSEKKWDTTTPTLQQVQKRGVLRCGVGEITPGLHYFVEGDIFDADGEQPQPQQQQRTGFDVALCRAIAAAIFGSGEDDNDRVEYYTETFKSRFQSLASGKIDVLAGGTTHTMEREINEATTQSGFAFSSPYLYEGLQLAGDPQSVGCIENDFKNTEECSLITICVIEGTSHHIVLSSLLPGRQLEVVDSYETMIETFAARKCTLIAAEGLQLQPDSVRDLGYRGSYRVGDQTFSKEPLALVSRNNDPQWSTFVDSIVQGLLVAEKHDITQSEAHLLRQTHAFGEQYSNMFRNSIGAVGNYGELYDKFLEPIVPRKKINQINYGNGSSSSSNNNTRHAKGGGLLYSHPLGNVENDGVANVGYMENMQQLHGRVRCGVILGRPGFAARPTNGGHSYRGIEIDLCRALSAAVFDGASSEFDIVRLDKEQDGYAALREGLVDVFAGASWTFETSTTAFRDSGGKSNNPLAFSPPYFYSNASVEGKEENLCLATNARDSSWSSFVSWIVAGLVYAEELNITSRDANEMPRVNLFGGGAYSRMFRDIILEVGNYGEIYNRSLQELYPRQGRNLLNGGFNPGPQHYALPGLVAT